MDFDELAIKLFFVLTVINIFFFYVHANTGVANIDTNPVLSLLPSTVFQTGFSSVSGTDVNIQAGSAISTSSSFELIPFLIQTASLAPQIFNMLFELVFGYARIFNIIGVPPFLAAIIVAPISLISLYGVFSLGRKLLASIPFIGK